jgi:hypothetical protein
MSKVLARQNNVVRVNFEGKVNPCRALRQYFTKITCVIEGKPVIWTENNTRLTITLLIGIMFIGATTFVPATRIACSLIFKAMEAIF